MIGKLIGAALGKAAAERVGRGVGGTTGALIGLGLASRMVRKIAFVGLAVVGANEVYKRYMSSHPRSQDGDMAAPDDTQT